MGANLKLRRMAHRMIASYLRAVVTVLTTLSVASAISSGVDLAFLATVAYSLLGALIGPIIVFLTEAADLLDDPVGGPVNNDKGESALMTIVAMLAIFALGLYIFRHI